jgi:hypothetical protein
MLDVLETNIKNIEKMAKKFILFQMKKLDTKKTLHSQIEKKNLKKS